MVFNPLDIPVTQALYPECYPAILENRSYGEHLRNLRKTPQVSAGTTTCFKVLGDDVCATFAIQSGKNLFRTSFRKQINKS